MVGEGAGCWVDRGVAIKEGAEHIRQKKNETLRVDRNLAFMQDRLGALQGDA